MLEVTSRSPIHVKRVYQDADAADGARYLVDRVWPRGVAKRTLRMRAWLRDLGPSDTLRRWFGHDPERWTEFKKRYFAELSGKRDLWEPLLDEARRGTVTLLYSARNEEMNQAVALRAFLERQIRAARPSRRKK